MSSTSGINLHCHLYALKRFCDYFFHLYLFLVIQTLMHLCTVQQRVGGSCVMMVFLSIQLFENLKHLN